MCANIICAKRGERGELEQESGASGERGGSEGDLHDGLIQQMAHQRPLSSVEKNDL